MSACATCQHFLPDAPGVRWGDVEGSGRCHEVFKTWSAESRERTWKDWAEVSRESGEDCPVYSEAAA